MILVQPRLQFVNLDGTPMDGAKAYFTEKGTTNPSPVYQDEDLTQAHPNPVVANAQGVFPTIFYDLAVPIRMRVIANDGDLSTPFLDVDPCSLQFTITAEDIPSDVIIASLGYTPVDPDNAAFTAPARNQPDDADALNADDVGFRGAPVVQIGVSRNMLLSDSGKRLVKLVDAAYTYTILQNSTIAWPIGHSFQVQNEGVNPLTIGRGASVHLHIAGAVTDKDVALAQYGAGRVTQYDANKWIFEGVGGT
jgi:hypothetical protein